MITILTLSKPGRRWRSTAAAMLSGLLLLSLGACAGGKPVPTEALRSAEQAIDTADRARVNDYAAAELSQARDILANARLAVQQKDMLTARHSAEQAKVLAELALVKSGLGQAQAVNAEMQKSIDVLKQEMQRNSGGKP